MRSFWFTLTLLTLFACGEGDNTDEVEPDGEAPDAEAESEAGPVEHDAGTAEEPDAEAGAPDVPEMPQITFSGALTATVENGETSATWTKASDLTSLLHLPAAGGPLIAGFSFTFKGTPEAGKTYEDMEDGFSCVLTVTRMSDNAAWVAARAIPRQTDQGTCSLSLSAVEESRATDTLKQFTVHGSVEGTLSAAEGSAAEGSVTMHTTL